MKDTLDRDEVVQDYPKGDMMREIDSFHVDAVFHVSQNAALTSKIIFPHLRRHVILIVIQSHRLRLRHGRASPRNLLEL